MYKVSEAISHMIRIITLGSEKAGKKYGLLKSKPHTFKKHPAGIFVNTSFEEGFFTNQALI